MNDLHPDKVIVFTKKGWKCWPEADGGIPEGVLLVEGADEVEWRSYETDHGDVIAYGLRHPQFASTDTMKQCVAAILAHEPRQPG